MALSATTIAFIKTNRSELRAQIQRLQTEKQSHQGAIQSINSQIADCQAKLQALLTDLSEVPDN